MYVCIVYFAFSNESVFKYCIPRQSYQTPTFMKNYFDTTGLPYSTKNPVAHLVGFHAVASGRFAAFVWHNAEWQPHMTACVWVESVTNVLWIKHTLTLRPPNTFFVKREWGLFYLLWNVNWLILAVNCPLELSVNCEWPYGINCELWMTMLNSLWTMIQRGCLGASSIYGGYYWYMQTLTLISK